MKHIEKIIIVLIIIAPIVWGYISLKPYMEEDDIVEDIVSEGLIGEQEPNSEVVQTEIENDINEYQGEMQGEKYISTIGNPVGKIVMGGEINISVANVYLEADENSEVVDTITKHSIVTAQAYPGGWSRIKSDNISGWMKTDHITLPPDSGDVNIGSVIGRIGTVNVDSLNVRASASANAKKITSIIDGTDVTILAISGDGEWYQVKINSKTEGWVAKKYLTIK
ncbi:MAG: SH3 domain-containing protein [Clostridia bacterium]|nr:SH3 domain-containing protein [Clostridia bacterium]